MRAKTQEVAEATNDSVQQLRTRRIGEKRGCVFAIRESPTPERGKRPQAAETRTAIVLTCGLRHQANANETFISLLSFNKLNRHQQP